MPTRERLDEVEAFWKRTGMQPEFQIRELSEHEAEVLSIARTLLTENEGLKTELTQLGIEIDRLRSGITQIEFVSKVAMVPAIAEALHTILEGGK